MSFYRQHAAILHPAKVGGRYGGDERLEYKTELGATRTPIPFGVDIQPRTELEIGATGERVQTQTGWNLYTPPGRDLDVTEIDRITYGGRDLEIEGEVHRWPSADFPSGVDHVSLSLVYRNG